MHDLAHRCLLRQLVLLQLSAGLLWSAWLALASREALLDGVLGWAVMALASILSLRVALGGGVLDAARAAHRGVLAIVLRWGVAIPLLVLLSARDGAVVWAVVLGALCGQFALLASTYGFRRI